MSQDLASARSNRQRPANFCPRCGQRNTSRSSRCAGCERDLPPLPAPCAAAAQGPSAALSMCVSAASDCGRRRADTANEDDFLVVTGTRRAQGRLQPFGLFVVADGMGGHDDGQQASHLTIKAAFEYLAPWLISEALTEEDVLPLMQGALQSANRALYTRNRAARTNMGSTVTAAFVAGHEARICNVGDSRVYLLGAASPLQRLTVDHSFVEGLVMAGVIQREDVYTHPKRNRIYRSLGQQELVQIDTFCQSVAASDQLLLCSDGLWEMLRDAEIERVLRQYRDKNSASKLLIELANEHGGADNITALLVEMGDEAAESLVGQPGIERVDANSSAASFDLPQDTWLPPEQKIERL
jgi:serine/threonine protein phosphatase PrpC